MGYQTFEDLRDDYNGQTLSITSTGYTSFAARLMMNPNKNWTTASFSNTMKLFREMKRNNVRTAPNPFSLLNTTSYIRLAEFLKILKAKKITCNREHSELDYIPAIERHRSEAWWSYFKKRQKY